jgi:carboxylesterase type B
MNASHFLITNELKSSLFFASTAISFQFQALITSEETALAEMTSDFWSTFALKANPNSGSENWPLYTTATDEVYVLATENGPTAPGPLANLKEAKCDWWDSQYIAPEVMFGYPLFV